MKNATQFSAETRLRSGPAHCTITAGALNRKDAGNRDLVDALRNLVRCANSLPEQIYTHEREIND